MKLNIYADQPIIAMGPTASRKLTAYQEGENGYTLNYMQGKKGAGAPPHSHPHLQVVYILEGEGEFLCGDETAILKSGDVVQVDANVPHTFNSFITDMKWLEFFTPTREDFAPQK